MKFARIASLNPLEALICRNLVSLRHFRAKHRNFQNCLPTPFLERTLKCEKKFKHQKHLKKHLETAHRKKEVHNCPHADCEKTFSTSSNLAGHINQCHSKRTDLTCLVCERRFGKHGDLVRHQKRKDCNKTLVHASKPRPYSCTDCDKAFSSKETLKTHRDVFHTKVGLHHCVPCEQNFSSKYRLVLLNIL